MSHPDDDKLLQSVLHLLSEQEEMVLKDHLSKCSVCRTRLDQLQEQTDLIGNIELETDRPVYPLPPVRRKTLKTIMKIAALILIGFIAGYCTSDLSRPFYVNVIPQQLEITTASRSITEFTPCEKVDMDIGYY